MISRSDPRLYERPNISIALFISDYLQLAGVTRCALPGWWRQAHVAAFFALFVVHHHASVRKTEAATKRLASRSIGSDQFCRHGAASQVGESSRRIRCSPAPHSW
jgi:hypothetical protein